MSNLELAQRFVDLARKVDWRQLDLMAEDVVYRPIAEVTETGEYHGRDGYRRYMEAFLEGEWASDLEFGPTTLREYGDADDGLIVRVEDFIDRDMAVAAAGAAE
jgi:hypothetical protein